MSSEVTSSGRDSEIDSANEQGLIEAAQAGDKKAFGQLLRLHQKRLFRFIYGLTGSFDQTEDLVQEAFVKAYGAIATFRIGHAFYPWLSTIARNLTFNYLKREGRKESLDKLSESGFDRESDEPDPINMLLDTEAQRRFYDALRSMPGDYRKVFVLRHFENMEYSEIANALKIPPGTVDSRLYRARQYLLDKLKDLL